MHEYDLREGFRKLKYGEENFHNLMQRRVHKILLVATLYDAYTLEHDGRLSEKIVGDYMELNLTSTPRITSVTSSDEALEKLSGSPFDLVITTLRPGGDTSAELCGKIHEIYPALPVILLLTHKSEMEEVEKNREEMKHYENIYLWRGDSKLFVAIVKSVEDKWNSRHDTSEEMVRIILLVEDSITFKSLYLPLLYQEVMLQTQRLIADEYNNTQKFFRMRSRPKILLAANYEEAMAVCSQFSPYILAVISDNQFPREGILDPSGGINLIKELKKRGQDSAMMLQSRDRDLKKKADSLGIPYIHKNSPTLLTDLTGFLLDYLGFGDFRFLDNRGHLIASASSLAEMETLLTKIPIGSILYHAGRNHFSDWLIAHGEFEVARRVRPLKNEDFSDHEKHRTILTDIFREARLNRNRGQIVDFSPEILDCRDTIVMLTEGSLGGKGRGLAFLNAFIHSLGIRDKYPDMDIGIPPTAIIGTAEYTEFMKRHKLAGQIENRSDNAINTLFVSKTLSPELKKKLVQLLEYTGDPLAVRSSSLLEDSHRQPFAGVYRTFMIPNNHEDSEVRLTQLCRAVKLVFASIFLKEARTYLTHLNYSPEEEQMAVIIQSVAGTALDHHWFPPVSGVAQSYNYYPLGHLVPDDPIVSLSAGLGISVVEGESRFSYCPRFPDINFLSDEEYMKQSQGELYTLDLKNPEPDLLQGEHISLNKLSIREANKEGALNHILSWWDGHSMTSGLGAGGNEVLTFADVIKYDCIPLNNVLEEILEISEKSMALPVEMEFAFTLGAPGQKAHFYLLQMRPMGYINDEIKISMEDFFNEPPFLRSPLSMGQGIKKNIRDIVCICPENFDKTRTREMAGEIESINRKLESEGREYLLIGPGRWGTRDPFLGIPVQWSQIKGARVIVETTAENFEIEPSQGSHFFHNLVSMNGGYVYIAAKQSEDNFLNRELLESGNEIFRGRFFRHLVFNTELKIYLNGRQGKAVMSL